MDGNGRWARERGLPRIEGHRRGSEAVRACTAACLEAGVPFLTLYAFSKENWQRPPDEVKALMTLLDRFLAERTAEIMERNIRLRAIGHLDDLPAKARKRLDDSMARSAGNTALTLTLALSYGSRTEITDAARAIAREAKQGLIDPDAITEETISSHLYTAGQPDPDLLVRTSGEMRISNFLLWQLSYTEIVVTDKLWPDFGKEDLFAAIREYAGRHRRFGGV
ncbi:MAG: di-trans,poly-cis-decaprenylcistransferase [Chthoniobacterales bacterium]|nr:di-trans,poly-cis-decaprenylcistransferase [Chthoniobacterales bacterium]